MEDKNQVHAAAVPRQWGTHAGEDVPVYALGPLATTLFAGWYPAYLFFRSLAKVSEMCVSINNLAV